MTTTSRKRREVEKNGRKGALSFCAPVLYGKLVSSLTKWVTVPNENYTVFGHNIPSSLASSLSRRMVVQLIRDAVKLLNDHMKKVKFLSIEFFLTGRTIQTNLVNSF